MKSGFDQVIRAGSGYPELDWAVKEWPRTMNMDTAMILEEIRARRGDKVPAAEALFIMVNDIIGEKRPRQN